MRRATRVCRTWGARRVKLVAGGDIYAPAPARAQAGELVRLKYKAVCRELTGLRHGAEAVDVPFRAVTAANLERAVADLDEDVHPWLGARDRPIEKPKSMTNFPTDDGVGCRVLYVERASASDVITQPVGGVLVRDERVFENWRFERTSHTPSSCARARVN